MTTSGNQSPDVPDIVEYPVRGVDVSSYQGDIDWSVLVRQNITFAFIKATEGVDHVDPKFEDNWSSSAGCGIYVGAYHFYRFEDTGAEQAAHYIATVPKRDNTLPPVIDVELYPSLTETPNAEEVRTELQDMLDALETYYNVKPILYSAPNTYREYISSFAGEYSIWIANYYYEPYIDWDFWQYSNTGELAGYNGDQKYIDLNVYRGSKASFLAEFGLS